MYGQQNIKKKSFSRFILICKIFVQFIPQKPSCSSFVSRRGEVGGVVV